LSGGRPWNRTRHGSPRRSYSPLPHLAARRPTWNIVSIDNSCLKLQDQSHKNYTIIGNAGHQMKPRIISQHKKNSYQFWLYGLHPVASALANNKRLKHRLVVSENALRKLSEPIKESGIRYEIVDVKAINHLLEPGIVHQGVALEVSTLHQPSTDELLNNGDKIGALILLDGITDANNVGAIIRTAEAFYAQGIITTVRNSPSESGVLAKASSGALERLPFIKVPNLVGVMQKLKKNGYWIAGLDVNGDCSLNQAITGVNESQIVFVLGSEGKGLRQATKECCDFLVRISTNPTIGSINVSNAAAICLYAGQTLSPKP